MVVKCIDTFGNMLTVSVLAGPRGHDGASGELKAQRKNVDRSRPSWPGWASRAGRRQL